MLIQLTTWKNYGMRDVGFRVLNLSLKMNMEHRIKQCDFIIEPAADFTIFDINKQKSFMMPDMKLRCRLLNK
ncbi:MAG: hypothetical protein IPL12_21375 [Bacteroidetes bacterium]|nr:hypothetical protein [Bacteroidota bacterium]